MICSSVNLLFFMSAILHGLTDFLLLTGMAYRGQVSTTPQDASLCGVFLLTC